MDEKLDLTRDQHLMSIRPKIQGVSHIEIVDGKITTSGWVGDCVYDNFVELIRGLQGHGLKIDDFYF